MANALRHTNFKFGFNLQGKRESNTGEGLVGTYHSPETWTSDQDGEKMEGTPVQIDTSGDKMLQVCNDAEEPDFYLYTRVADDLTDLEWMTGAVKRDEVRGAGDPVTCVIPSKKAMLETDLLHGTNTPTTGDDVYIEGGLFSNNDTTAGSGVVIGTVKNVVTIDGTDYAQILLK